MAGYLLFLCISIPVSSHPIFIQYFKMGCKVMRKKIIIILLLIIFIVIFALGYRRIVDKHEPSQDAEYVDAANTLKIVKDMIKEEDKAEYVNRVYKVSFMYPKNWQEKEESRDKSGVPTAYEGKHGFFKIDTIEGNNIDMDTIAVEMVQKKEKPYGESPHMYSVEINNTGGIFIIPSYDQNEKFKEQAAFIVKYPEPVIIDGRAQRYFVLYSDVDKIEKIVKSLNFLK
ncbi:hypothetical protein EDD71_11197 [Fonticella tunisiensis]|uniref:Uncharacterized protein n=2 Tax=Fonticella tunisiensis TaxID=1096341 RepID=A0A4R7KSP8_9CLOT|nr:hypothetical protein EDD71_11197 [Fonticella tunisiensis]